MIELFFGSKEHYVPGLWLVRGGRFALGGAGEDSRSAREIRAVRMLAGKEAKLHLEQCFFTFGRFFQVSQIYFQVFGLVLCRLAILPEYSIDIVNSIPETGLP